MAVTKVVMPKLSEAMESGKIIKWLKKEGDRIAPGDILAEVETDKADVEMEAFGAGVLRKILAQAGSTAPVGSLIGVIAEPDDDIAAVASAPAAPAPAAAKSAPAPTKPAAGAAPPAPAKTGAGAPAMASRPAEVPPTPKSEDPAERPKPAPVTATSGTARAAASSSADHMGGLEGSPKPPDARTRPGEPGTRLDDGQEDAGSGRVKASPLAKKIAAQSGVDLKLIQGSGPGGRIIRRDVEAASAAPAARPGAAAEAGV